MAIKIPDAPNIVNSDIELRSPQMVEPVTNIPRFAVDFSNLQKSVGDITSYYKEMARDQTETYFTDIKNDYLQHMTSYQNDLFQKKQGKFATDLYAQFVKKESDAWLADKIGAPKDDGKIRVSDPEIQKRLSEWVDSQQPHFINSTANYEEREWDKYRESVFKARDNAAANLILNATSDITMQNGIEAIRTNAYAQNPGLDKDFIEQAIASKVDASLVGHLTNVAQTDPMRAYRELTTYEPVVNNLTAPSREKVMENIRKSWKTMGIDEFAHHQIGEGGSTGMVMNEVMLGDIFGRDNVAEVKAEMISKGEERAAALRKTQQGQQAVVINAAMGEILSARTDADFAQGVRDLYAASPDAANAIVASRDAYLANLQDLQNAGLGANDRIKKIDEQMKYLGDDAARAKLIAAGVPESEVESSLQKASKLAGKKLSGDIDEAKLQKVIDNLVADEGEYNRFRVEAAARMWKTSMKRQDQMPRYKELAARIGSGEIRAYDPVLMGDLDWPIQVQLSNLIENNNNLIETKKDLLNAGVNLDKVISDNGIDAQYDKLDVASQNLLKRNIVYEINAAKTRNQGITPDEYAINGIALRVQKNSVSPMMGLLQDTALAENMSADTLTDAQRLELGIRESMKWEYNKPAKRSLSDQQSRAEATIDRLSNSSRLNEDEQQYIKQNKAYLVSLLQAGDLAGLVNFIGLATQGGFQ